MTTSLTRFRNDLYEGLVDFLWRQWCRLGVPGTSEGAAGAWVIDPEPLLAFTSEMGRHDARTFDLALDWLRVNGFWVNTQRLSSIMARDGTGSPAVMGAMAAWMCDLDKSMKWRGIARRNKEAAFRPSQPLIHTIPFGGSSDAVGSDPHFAAYGLLREAGRPRAVAKPVNLKAASNLMFRSRTLFGIGVQADVMVYLLATGGGHARGIAGQLGYNHMRVQEILNRLGDAGFASVRTAGRTKTFGLDRESWRGILYPTDASIPQWVNWRLLTRGMTRIWRDAWALDEKRADDYIVSSKMRTAMRAARDDLQGSGVGLHVEDDRAYTAEAYLPVFLRDIRSILATLSRI